jgi:protein-disulfide isomerase
MLRRQFLLATPLLLAARPVSAADKHWLLGAWEGQRKNVSQRTRTGAERKLVVTSVNAAGTSAKAQWIVSTGTLNVTLAIDGNAVSFTTPGAQGNSYKLTRKGEALEGAWTNQSRGNSGAIELYKQ